MCVCVCAYIILIIYPFIYRPIKLFIFYLFIFCYSFIYSLNGLFILYKYNYHSIIAMYAPDCYSHDSGHRHRRMPLTSQPTYFDFAAIKRVLNTSTIGLLNYLDGVAWQMPYCLSALPKQSTGRLLR